MRFVETRPPMTDSELKICNDRLDKNICKMDEPCEWACDEVYILNKVREIVEEAKS